MDLIQLKAFAKEIINNKPKLKSEILELFYLAVSEIEDGSSEFHECQLAYNDMEELNNDN
jgi:hypothetical protein